MSFTIYPNQFKMRESGQYVGLSAIKGDTGNTGPQGPKGDTGETGAQGATGATGAAAGFGTVTATVDGSSGTPSVQVTTSGTNEALNIQFAFSGLKGDGIGGGTFTPLVSYAAQKPSSADNNTMWVKDSSSYTLGSVILGSTSTAPTNRPDGTTLQDGDLYVMSGKNNNHPIVWGNVILCPFRCWVRVSGSWVYKDAEIKYSGTWYPMNSEWFIENGIVVGAAYIPTASDGGVTYETVNNEFVATFHATSSGNKYPTFGFGTEVDIHTNPFTFVIEGTLTNGSAANTGRFGAGLLKDAGGISLPSLSAQTTISNNTSLVNPMYYCTKTSSVNGAPMFALGMAQAQNDQVIASIKNAYRVFSDITGV